MRATTALFVLLLAVVFVFVLFAAKHADEREKKVASVHQFDETRRHLRLITTTPPTSPPTTAQVLSMKRHPSRTLQRIKQCESGGDYHAVNERSGAGGAYQVLPSSWDNYGGYEHAEDAPKETQDAWAAEAYRQAGTTPWAASRGCWS